MFRSGSSLLADDVFVFDLRAILTYCWSTIAATLIVTLGLFISTQLSGYNPINLKSPVNRTACTCDCWDGFFRGMHSREGYKTFYINYEIQTIILIGIFLFYVELLRNFLVKILCYQRWNFLLLLPAIYPNFYGTWNIINYLNDHDYHRMLPSQVFFAVTELMANYIFYRCLLISNANLAIQPWCLYLIGTICSVHTLLAVKELNIQLILRNMGILIPDLLALLWVSARIRQDQQLRPDQRSICIWILIGCSILLFYYIVCPYRD